MLVIYHNNCLDGFAAAWVTKQHLVNQNPEFFAATHGDPPPDVTGKDVYIVDFCYPRTVLLEMADRAKSILILDHHKSAQADLVGLTHPKIMSVFNMEKSGAGLAWDFFFTTYKRPKIIDHIEDRDLWTFKHPKTKAINAALFSYPYDFSVFTHLATVNPETLYTEGQSILRKQDKDIRELIATAVTVGRIGGYIVPVINAPYMWGSDAAHLLCDREIAIAKEQFKPLFAAYYWDSATHRNFGLRSVGEFDVSQVASLYKGGGHLNAAGFRLPIEQCDGFRVKHYTVV
jgi:oligoribonuclease NrnB/cAMP/cGMP phosphodiesterase (DHH superfamily)